MSLDQTRIATSGGTEPTTDARPLMELGAPWLVIASCSSPEAIGRVLAIREESVIVGRGEEADLVIQDRGISRQHAAIRRSASGEFTIEDLRSTNGTHVNGVRIRCAALREGDRIQIGTTTVLRFSRREHLEDGELRLRQALSVAGVGTWEWDVASGSLSFAGGAERLVSWAGRNALLAVHAEDRQRLRDDLSRALEGTGAASLEARIHGDDDRISWIAMRGEVLRDESGAPLRVVGAVLDVTSRRKAEQEMRRNALIFDCLNDAVLVVGLQGVIEDWNAAAVRLFGFEQAEALGRTPGELLEPGEPQPFLPLAVEAIARDGHWRGERKLRRRGGDACTSELVAVPLRDPDGHHLGNLVVCRDVTEQRLLQARLMLSDRLSAMGMLAAGVAHEIKNPLAFVSGDLAYLEEMLEAKGGRGLPHGGEARQVVAEMREGLRRIDVIVRDLQSYTRSDVEEAPRGADVRRAVEYAVRITNAQTRKHGRVVVDLGDVPRVAIAESRLGQILVNLLVNAAQALEGSGARNEIRISTSWNGEAVLLRVSDTGPGIPTAILPRIFEPLFTTKPAGSGTGLGLFVCSNLAKAAGGDITVATKPGEGATFTVSLRPAPSAPVAPRLESGGLQGGGRGPLRTDFRVPCEERDLDSVG